MSMSSRERAGERQQRPIRTDLVFGAGRLQPAMGRDAELARLVNERLGRR